MKRDDSPVQDLIGKIEAAAETHLSFPPGITPPEKLSRYKDFLKVQTHRLKLWHRAGADGQEICAARAAMLDTLLRHLWESARSSLSPQAQAEFPPLALVAIGGYGRGELNPHSDIDFMFLHDGQIAANRPLPHLSKLIDGVLYPLWDMGLKVGHAVRSIEDCVKIANTDMQSKTSLIEARWVTGDEALFKKFQKTLVAKCVVGFEDKYIAARLEDQETRRAKYGNSACMQEPNLKNGCGGLRDFQNLLWMTFFKYRTRSLADLQQREFVSAAERKQLEAAYDFLMRARTELHYDVNRPLDVLTKNLQPTVAHNLGYTERSPSRRIEKFMRVLYTHMRNIFIITRTLEQRMALLPPSKNRLSLRRLLPLRKRKPPEPVDGFLFVDGEILAASNRVFRDSPRRLMRVFLHAQQRHLQLHPDLAQLIRNQISLVDREFLNDEHVRETFLTILERRGEVAPILRAMHEVNLLGKYIPEFGKLTCLVQHEFYHQYAADEHTLVCLEQLDKIWEAKNPPYKNYATLLQDLERPGLIYLALLLHDVGKASDHQQGKHPEAGAALAMRAAKRLRLDNSATQTLNIVVKNHLLMANISQRRDLDDPAVIRNFARQIESAENLNLLTLLTFADSQGTSDKLWNGFKDALLWQLHTRALALLTGGSEFVRASEKQRELLRQEVRDIASKEISDDELDAHFEQLPQRYFEIHTAREILDDLELAHRFMHQLILEKKPALAPVTAWLDEPDRGYNLVKICTWDRAGLFSHIAGSLSAAGLNILGAQVFTRGDGVALDTFYVNDARTGNLASREQHDKFAAVLEKILNGEELDLSALIARQKSNQPAYEAYVGERLATEIHFDNDTSETRTLIEIETEDQLGLLYVISRTFAELVVDIAGARIVTERGAAIDSFYVRELDGGKIISPERRQFIAARLREAISRLETPR
ncbi:MAG TPA: [protein-PII] uridylyltransferase [Verrucomicrobiae bacterium]|nr:[protein-PII] uridylyltransferase [Verrucomicrobiae bacterium]